MTIDERVERLATLISNRLIADHWGLIEPEIFRNIANGLTGEEDPESQEVDQLVYDKCNDIEMLDNVAAMRKILKQALTEMGE